MTKGVDVSRLAIVALALGLPLIALQAQDDADARKPAWAYAVAPGAPIAAARGPQVGGARAGGQPGANGQPAGQPGGQPGGRRGGPPDTSLHSLAGSKFQFTRAQVSNGYNPADWFPEDHPAMPDIVAHGKQASGIRACAFCHMPNGKGRPENAPVAGLPKDYIVRQLKEFKSGIRDTAEPRKPKDMMGLTQYLTDEEMDQAAAYFAAMRWTQWIRVVESDVIPKTRVAGQMFHLVEDGTTEPIGNRIVEAPENEADEQLRAPRTGFVAYVPVGAIKKGEVLVTTGGGKTVPCVTCHGQDLLGIGTIPGIANRSPSYLGRQLYDFQAGARNGELAPLMKPVVEHLTVEDMVNILAYVSSRKP
jgi:cytochrome c553